MNITLIFYIIDLLSSIDCVLITSIFIIICFVVVLFIKICAYDYMDDEEKNSIYKYIKSLFISIFILIPLSVLIPSKESMYMMLSTSYLTNNHIPEKVSEIINYKLDSILKDMKKDTAGKK